MNKCKNCGHELIRSGLKRVRVWGHKGISAQRGKSFLKPVAILECIECKDISRKMCITTEQMVKFDVMNDAFVKAQTANFKALDLVEAYVNDVME